ncbi:MAG: PEP-CTERM sorting domain-containing protein [Aliivibrio sp.]|uniref:PEP-CTERM sorting domain-containing protein n=1 Tax=Aliivibrio sp. TaxID=1872443 RepID=UPI001A47EFC3|nr:PEP-CTERM sorting domain-containing protein [Aliivibrio sp.]
MKQITALIFAAFFTFSTSAMEIKGEFSGTISTFLPSSFSLDEKVTGNVFIDLDLAPALNVTPGSMSMSSSRVNWIDMDINIGGDVFEFTLDPSEYFRDSITLNTPLFSWMEQSLVIVTSGGEFLKKNEWASLFLVNLDDYIFGPDGMSCTDDCGLGGFYQGLSFASFDINSFSLGLVNPIPEPSTLLLFAFGLLGLRRVRF